MRNNSNNQGIYWAWFSALLLLLLGIYFLTKTVKHPIGDFANYYYASQLWLEGDFDERVYDPYSFNQLANQRSPETVFVNYTPVPPVSVLLYSPFALIKDIYWAKFYFGLIGLLLFIVAYCLLLRHLKLEHQALLLLAPLIFYMPLLNNFYQGQSYLYVLACLLEAYRQWGRHRIYGAAILWSVAIAMKIFPGIVLLFLFFQRDKRTCWLTFLISSFLSFSTYLFLPPMVTTDYFSYILPRLFQGEIHNPFAILFQSMPVLLKSCFVKDQLYNPEPFMHLPILAIVFHGLFQCMVLGGTFLVLRMKNVPAILHFALVLLAGNLLAAYGSSYSLLLLLPLFMAVLSWQKPGIITTILLLFLLLFICNVPVYWLHDDPLLLQFPRLYAMLGLFVMLIWILRPTLDVKTVVFVGILLFGKSLIVDFPQQKVGDYYLPNNNLGIIHSYRYENDQLIFKHLNQNGLQENIFKTTDVIRPDKEVYLSGNQIYYRGRQISDSKGQKRSPMRLNEDEVIYLSDEGRGVGFYTLRRMAL
ncbi:MAG: hypothetical protein DHS20C18_15960 [Saprospiraceae bacterium]|nr:MAG: hypothetical protein DHS20C18_15960 [Saprospiraceae bacterium]